MLASAPQQWLALFLSKLNDYFLTYVGFLCDSVLQSFGIQECGIMDLPCKHI